MRCVAMMVKRLACVALCLAPLGLGAEEDGAAQAARRWAWDQLKARSFRRPGLALERLQLVLLQGDYLFSLGQRMAIAFRRGNQRTMVIDG